MTILPKKMTPNVFFPIHSRSGNNKLNRPLRGSVINEWQIVLRVLRVGRQVLQIDKRIHRRVLREDK